MREVFEAELREMLEKIEEMGGHAEAMMQLAIRALLERNESLSAEVYERERRVNALQVEVDERMAKVIVHQQPVAKDARFIIVASKVATDLERIGDHAISICRNARFVLQSPPFDPLPDLQAMFDAAKKMVADSLGALVTRDTQLAEQVLADEKRANGLRDQIFRTLLTCMITDPLTARRSLSLVLISQSLERIADHATNIAEEVIYLIRGQDVRHQYDKPARA